MDGQLALWPCCSSHWLLYLQHWAITRPDSKFALVYKRYQLRWCCASIQCRYACFSLVQKVKALLTPVTINPLSNSFFQIIALEIDFYIHWQKLSVVCYPFIAKPLYTYGCFVATKPTTAHNAVGIQETLAFYSPLLGHMKTCAVFCCIGPTFSVVGCEGHSTCEWSYGRYCII